MAHAFLYTGIAALLIVWGGNQLCRGIFSLTGLRDAIADLPSPAHTAGRWIGALERTIFAIGIVTGRWEILAAVIALKTVARFKELDDRSFAEYFLIGSLFSLFWTIVVTGAWLVYDHRFGIDVRNAIAQSLAGEEKNVGPVKTPNTSLQNAYTSDARLVVSVLTRPTGGCVSYCTT